MRGGNADGECAVRVGGEEGEWFGVGDVGVRVGRV